MIRGDLSNKLIHLTKGETPLDGYPPFLSILDQAKLIGGTGYIKGKHKCVCFSEAPIHHLGTILSNRTETGMKYSPLGIMFSKDYIYGLGGRPVIYQEQERYKILPPEINHLHMRLELNKGENNIDFTHEREWRLKIDFLSFTPKEITIIVPTRRFLDLLKDAHDQNCRKAYNTSKQEKDITQFPWHSLVLEDLGIPIPDNLDDLIK